MIESLPKRHERIESWVHSYLLGPGANKALSQGLRLQTRFYLALAEFPLAALTRTCGPEESMPFRESAEDFERASSRMVGEIRSGWDPPPLIVEWTNDKLSIADGNHRYEALCRAGLRTHPVVFWFNDKASRNAFRRRHRGLVVIARSLVASKKATT